MDLVCNKGDIIMQKRFDIDNVSERLLLSYCRNPYRKDGKHCIFN